MHKHFFTLWDGRDHTKLAWKPNELFGCSVTLQRAFQINRPLISANECCMWLKLNTKTQEATQWFYREWKLVPWNPHKEKEKKKTWREEMKRNNRRFHLCSYTLLLHEIYSETEFREERKFNILGNILLISRGKTAS